MENGSSVFLTLTHDERVIVRFIVKLFNFDENDSKDVIAAVNIMRKLRGAN